MYKTSNGQKKQLTDTRENYISPSPSTPNTSKKWIIAGIVLVILLFFFFVWKFGSKMFTEDK